MTRTVINLRIQCSKGFTLLELMFTVTVVAILAVIALPSYQNYTIRARVTEGLILASTAKLNVLEVASSGAHKGTGYLMGYTLPGNINSLSSLDIAEDTGVITLSYTASAGSTVIVLNPTGAPGLMLGGPEQFTPPALAISWVCSHTSAEEVYVPSSCR